MCTVRPSRIQDEGYTGDTEDPITKFPMTCREKFTELEGDTDRIKKPKNECGCRRFEHQQPPWHL